ncbi:hypothetical protein ARMGADRAFT_1017992 [Armillaria gallica]|uniref:Uncharacterized protein n=1 Tax=Armillaria gallica TaxID=47427 RepID=A0A2H3DAJ4_ARMGA|nr:hypothetical protein ARMGADRAFT_1017992 [Armillaria gallica]
MASHDVWIGDPRTTTVTILFTRDFRQRSPLAPLSPFRGPHGQFGCLAIVVNAGAVHSRNPQCRTLVGWISNDTGLH